MSRLRLLDVTPATLPLLQAALEGLAMDLGDPYRIEPDTLRAALFAPHPACHGVLALGDADALLGAAMYSPVLSTTAGGAGAFVSDLWVAPQARGRAIGRYMLDHVAARAQRLWQARFIRLVNYASNQQAQAFYTRLGFTENAGELVLQLSGPAFEQFNG